MFNVCKVLSAFIRTVSTLAKCMTMTGFLSQYVVFQAKNKSSAPRIMTFNGGINHCSLLKLNKGLNDEVHSLASGRRVTSDVGTRERWDFQLSPKISHIKLRTEILNPDLQGPKQPDILPNT